MGYNEELVIVGLYDGFGKEKEIGLVVDGGEGGVLEYFLVTIYIVATCVSLRVYGHGETHVADFDIKYGVFVTLKGVPPLHEDLGLVEQVFPLERVNVDSAVHASGYDVVLLEEADHGDRLFVLVEAVLLTLALDAPHQQAALLQSQSQILPVLAHFAASDLVHTLTRVLHVHTHFIILRVLFIYHVS